MVGSLAPIVCCHWIHRRALPLDLSRSSSAVKIQCAINTGSVMVCSTLRDAPPSMNSRAWLWP